MQAPKPDYGRALRKGFLEAKGDVVVNFDVDFVRPRVPGSRHVAHRPQRLCDRRRLQTSPGAKDNRTPARRADHRRLLRDPPLRLWDALSDRTGSRPSRRTAALPLVETCQFGKDIFDTE